MQFSCTNIPKSLTGEESFFLNSYLFLLHTYQSQGEKKRKREGEKCAAAAAKTERKKKEFLKKKSTKSKECKNYRTDARQR